MHVLAAVIAVLAIDALAQSDSDYQGWMKSIAANLGSLNTNIAGKHGVDASTDADKLKATFKQVEEYWKKRGGADDAVNFAYRAQTAAAAAAKAAIEGNLNDAAAQVKNLQAACGGCHMAHREGTPGSFKIKM
jgi:cytochrome c556